MNLNFLLALQKIRGVGSVTILKLKKKWPNLGELFALSLQEMLAAGIKKTLAIAIKNFDFSLLEKDLQWACAENNYLLDIDNELYPPLLKEIYDPPVILYARGNIKLLAAVKIAVVGSRSASFAALKTTQHFASQLSQNSITVVSGLALGVDAAAHRGALANTIAVMGTGIDIIYPSRHQSLADDIINNNGLLLAEFALATKPLAANFPKRNRIISGLAHATLVVEAALKSGSLITARNALEQNREVMAIPGNINNPLASGCHSLIQQGAHLITSVDDILDIYQNFYHHRSNVCELPMQPAIKLAKEQQNLVQCINFETTTIEDILKKSCLELDPLTCQLADLELDEIIKAVPGGYIRC